MKSMIAPLLLAVTALMQSMGLYQYHDDRMTLVGQLLFPILLSLMSAYLSRRGTPGSFSTLHTVILVASLVLLALSLAGMILRIPELYPSVMIYYLSFVFVAIECGLRIAGTPKNHRQKDHDGPTPTETAA